MRTISKLALIGLAGCAPGGIATAPPPPPEVSHAWATFDRHGIRSSGAGGEADRTAGRLVTVSDEVRIASVSKLVVALAVMRLVEQGRLDLDEDVSPKLGWRVRNPAFPDDPITLRLLLSHRSSIRDQGDNYVIPLGQTVQAMLEDPRSFDGSHAPGTFFRYSNLNFPVIASVMERETGERFDRLAERLVLRPLGLGACFNWSGCGASVLGRAVVLYEEDGSPLRDDLRGRAPPCVVTPAVDGSCDLEGYVPGTNGALFSPQGGLRISVTDLATVGRLLLNRGLHEGRPFLTERSIETIVRPEWRFDGTNGETDGGFYCAYGLGVQILPGAHEQCRDDLFGSDRQMVGHAGDAYRVRSGLWVDRERGVGIAYFAANNGKDPPRGRTAYRAVEEWLAAKLDD